MPQLGIRYEGKSDHQRDEPSFSPKTSGPGTARPRAGPRHQGTRKPATALVAGAARYRSGYGTAVVAGGVRSVVQYMHLRAAIGIVPRHAGQSRSIAACLRVSMSSSLPTGVTTRK